MTYASTYVFGRLTSAVAALVFTALLAAGCKQEPTIVIKFEPNDMSAAKGPDLAPRAAASVDGGMAAGEAAGAGEGKAGTPGKAGAPGKPAKAECKVAADCVVEPTSCCGCNNGGKQHAVTKAVAKANAAKHKAECGHTMCPMIMSNDPSCSQHADCVQGACVLSSATKK